MILFKNILQEGIEARPRFLYHSSLTQNLQSILKYGLQPRQERKMGWESGNKIYLTSTLNNALSIAAMFNNAEIEQLIDGKVVSSYPWKGTYCILKIDTNELSNEFFVDVSTHLSHKSYYTKETIPAIAISLVTDNHRSDEFYKSDDYRMGS